MQYSPMRFKICIQHNLSYINYDGVNNKIVYVT